MKLFSFTLDLEPEYSGQIDRDEILLNKEKIKEILSILKSLEIKITVFVVGKLFDSHPDIVNLFQEYDCEFELHSYSHLISNTNINTEIEKGIKSYVNYFNRSPKGYRSPQGRISNASLDVLEKKEFLYDSSVFPSYYPNPFRYLFCKRTPHYLKNHNLLEIPLTSITPFRLTLSLSYLKLFGINFYFYLIRLFGLPDFICFDVHLHDFIVVESSYQKLSPFWKFVYGRNKYLGIDLCKQFITFIKQQGYCIRFMSEIVNLHKNKILN